jgi:hypothetical protein
LTFVDNGALSVAVASPGRTRPTSSHGSGSSSGATAFKAAVLAYSPLLYWTLDSGTGVTDQSGNGHNGSGVAGITVGGASPGPFTSGDLGCTDFDGVDDRVDASPSFTTFANFNQQTYLFFVNRDTATTDDCFFSDQNQGFTFSARPSGTANAWEFVDGATHSFANSTTTSSWIFVALVIDRTGDTAELFRNGASVASVADVQGPYSGGNLILGSSGFSGAPLDAKMSHFAIVNSKLTGTQISDLYALR